MINLVFEFILPIAITIIRGYIKSTDSTKDDIILDLVKDSIIYLSDQPNNTISKNIANMIDIQAMKSF